MDAFQSLYGILQKAGKLECRVNFDATEGKNSHDGQPMTLAGFVRGAPPFDLLPETFHKRPGGKAKGF